MKQCIKCRQQIDDTCDVCPYCGQWQSQVEEIEVIKNTKPCTKCKQQIPLDCEECTYCGQVQPVNSQSETNVNNEIDSKELEKEQRKKAWKISLIVGGIISVMVILITVISIAIPESDYSTPTESKETPIQTITEPTTIDNSVNGMGYYYFDNSLQTAISKYRQIAEDTDASGLVNTIDNITEDRFSKDTAYMFNNNEEVVENYYQYYNGDTAITIYTNANGEIPAFAYLYTSALTNGLNYDTQAQIEQLINKPAKWLYALSEDLTYDEAVEIYQTLYSKHLESITAAKSGGNYKIAHHYKGYSLLVSGNETTEGITILKTDSDFTVDIKVGDPSIFQPIEATTEPTDKGTEEETSNLEQVAASDSEITEAEDLLRKEAFGQNTLGFESETVSVLNAIYFYINDVTLEATKDYNGNITLKYTGTFEDETNYVIYEVDIKNGYVNFVGSSFDWEIYKEFFQTDLFNSYS